ncbi:ABC transporter ATP-binding protein [Oribacterium sp. C9]|uniref:ABC transporter ATP-binding protein n=1 Tax=Oribacterium sp. C9 TaxID=1943579 RepID=UPI0009901107|nr:ABC transporter ATP-binding protein [Oribacterium sp. C9]OON85291.1 ABC transporter ATP-binding protein [Oribacterium sp. C9]
MNELMLESKGVSKIFGGLTAVDQVDMKVFKGDIFGIIGPNGAGKTTFFNMCTGFYTASKGKLFFEGKDITKMSSDRIAQLGITRTFQNIKLFKYMNVLENISVGFHINTCSNVFDAVFHTKRYKKDEEYVMQKSMEILKKLGLQDYAYMMAGKLPYGIQRKVEIARALAVNPKLILLDEPAAGMNPMETDSLMEFIRLLNKDGYTIILIEHDMKFVMNLCNNIMVLNFGKKICEGTAEVVRNDQNVKEAYFGKGLTRGIA